MLVEIGDVVGDRIVVDIHGEVVPYHEDDGYEARLHAAVRSNEEALKLLTRCFESLAPSRLPGFKDHAKKTPEFATFISTAAFQQVLLTESKIAESKCSGGSRCATCPMRGNCGGKYWFSTSRVVKP